MPEKKTKDLEAEAAEFKSSRTPGLGSTDKTAMRYYFGHAVNIMYREGMARHSEEELFSQADSLARKMVEWEKRCGK